MTSVTGVPDASSCSTSTPSTATSSCTAFACGSVRRDRDHDFTGRHVAVIGTGASVVQFVPHLAEQAEKLYVFQLSPHWVTPRGDAEIPSRRRRLYGRLPLVQRLRCWARYWEFETLARGFLGHPEVVECHQQRALDFLKESVSDEKMRAVPTPD
ncbi:hypothetical protein ACRJ4B_04630 [Streptomyces sp. GTA36]